MGSSHKTSSICIIGYIQYALKHTRLPSTMLKKHIFLLPLTVQVTNTLVHYNKLSTHRMNCYSLGIAFGQSVLVLRKILKEAHWKPSASKHLSGWFWGMHVCESTTEVKLLIALFIDMSKCECSVTTVHNSQRHLIQSGTLELG